ncbi:hypothetical protein GSI_13490 [Ganoderma sinense ZZ0214-1]|uniref:RNA 3'-terminal phosphate cyclase n=1 Tax=Ganoderma sinense ZZ0214-1 TaxID=1077348 RepID=A0A2G8RQE5_9APHY|nr:hypothetical protein GSI_13490 [Ganoderma sinense ZZ0214-1]
MSAEEAVNIDGGVLEGGGQLLRIAVGLSALLSKPISIDNIRANRTPPGLKYQHAAGLRLVANICSAQLSGNDTGSSSIQFHPQTPPQTSESRPYSADPGTAGSIALLLQVSLPCLIFSPPTAGPSTLHLRGGTNATHSPQVDYMEHVFLPFIQKHFGLEPSLRVVKRGYYPKGGGEVHVSVPPVTGPLPAVTLIERGEIRRVYGRSYVAGLPKSLADTMRAAAIDILVESGIKQNRIKIESLREKPSDAVGSGSGIVIWAETYEGCVIGGSALGKKGMDASKVGQEAARELVNNLTHEGCVDEYMQDQMIIFLALAQGRSKVKTGPLTLHTRTAIWVIEQLSSAKFHIEETEHGAIIECEGIGYVLPPHDLALPPTSSSGNTSS